MSFAATAIKPVNWIITSSLSQTLFSSVSCAKLSCFGTICRPGGIELKSNALLGRRVFYLREFRLLHAIGPGERRKRNHCKFIESSERNGFLALIGRVLAHSGCFTLLPVKRNQIYSLSCLAMNCCHLGQFKARPSDFTSSRSLPFF